MPLAILAVCSAPFLGAGLFLATHSAVWTLALLPFATSFVVGVTALTFTVHRANIDTLPALSTEESGR